MNKNLKKKFKNSIEMNELNQLQPQILIMKNNQRNLEEQVVVVKNVVKYLFFNKNIKTYLLLNQKDNLKFF